MNTYNISKICIANYLERYGIDIRTDIVTIGKREQHGHITLYVKRIKIGEFKYTITNNDNNLELMYIKEVWINFERNKEIPVKLMKVILLYAICMAVSDEFKINVITLDATPNKSENRGSEFCLLCYYQTLGFEPADEETQDNFRKMSRACKRSKKFNKEYTNKQSICILCECQRLSIKIKMSEDDLDNLVVPMAVMFPLLIRELKETYDIII